MADPEDGAARWLGLVESARVGRLATHNAAGGIDLVPFVYAWLPEPAPLGRLVSAVDHKPKRHQRLRRLDNVARRPDVTVLVDHYTEDWSGLWWVRVRGLGREVDVAGERREALDALVAKYAPYQQRRPDGPVLAVDISTVTGWSAAGAPSGAPRRR